jgi:hypothetical protein
VAKQGYLAPKDHGGAGSQVAFSYCRSLYALALIVFPPKLSSLTQAWLKSVWAAPCPPDTGPLCALCAAAAAHAAEARVGGEGAVGGGPVPGDAAGQGARGRRAAGGGEARAAGAGAWRGLGLG